MIIKRIITDLMQSNMYVLVEDNYAIIIDPWIRSCLDQRLKPDKLIITHEHYDHISGVNYFKNKYGLGLLCDKECAERICDAKSNSARYFEAFSQLQTYNTQARNIAIDTNYTCTAEYIFDYEMQFSWHGNEFYLFSLPGHSPGSIGILVNEKYLFSGDSVFMDKDIELRFPGGSDKLWIEESIPKILSLSDDIIVYPGHGEKFTLKERREHGGF